MALNKKLTFWDRAIRNLRNAWSQIGSAEEYFSESSFAEELNENDRSRLIKQMQACLERRGGEVSARSRAAALGHAYLTLNPIGRRRFLGVLAEEFGTDKLVIDSAVKQLQISTDPISRMSAETALKDILEAPRIRLLTQFNGLPEGVKFLVDMRAELIDWVGQDAKLHHVERDLNSLLTSWFDVGFLELKQITWQAPAALLEKLFEYEAVHTIKSWVDLKNRLASDRRCFAFFHPRMPEEPLIFVWVALVEGMATNIQSLLDERGFHQDAEKADTAIFYSISNAQKGLLGINFGNFLIKRVVDNLSNELKGLENFSTLSPLPGFVPWLINNLDEQLLSFLTEDQINILLELADEVGVVQSILYLLESDKWLNVPKAEQALKPVLLRLAGYYIVNKKRPSGTALDSVGHFHLNNGARIEQINWAADTSEKGLTQSAGIMINYRYLLDDIEANHESYRSGQEIIISPKVQGLMKN